MQLEPDLARLTSGPGDLITHFPSSIEMVLQEEVPHVEAEGLATKYIMGTFQFQVHVSIL
jgi:hypothetical protein